MSLGEILLQFLYRLAGGLALALAATPHRWVMSGFFRVHSWVLLGLFSLAAAVTASQAMTTDLSIAVLAAVLSYGGSICWLYERTRAGKLVLWLIVLCSTCAMVRKGDGASLWWPLADGLTAATVLGFTTGAMLLGHWYLNSPTMRMDPLRRLLLAMMVAVAGRGLLEGWVLWQSGGLPPSGFAWAVMAIRWLAGLVGVAIVGAMAWQTLKIPNTQSATGILYVGVILAFLGELTAQFPATAMP